MDPLDSFPGKPSTARKIKSNKFWSGEYINIPAGFPDCYIVHRLETGGISYRIGRKIPVEEMFNAQIMYSFSRSIANGSDPRFSTKVRYLVFEDDQERLLALKLTDVLMNANRAV